MRNDNQLFWEAFQSNITESRRLPEVSKKERLRLMEDVTSVIGRKKPSLPR